MSSTPLVSPAMLDAVRAVGERGLQTEVSIMTRSFVEGTNGDPDTEEFVTTTTTYGWIRQNDRGPVIHDGGGGVAVSIGRYRIHLPWDVELEEGDLIGADGEIWIANEVNRENSLRVYTTVIARKRE